MPKTRVLVAEDSLTVRRHLAAILEAEPDIEVIGEAEDGRQAVAICEQHRPDVIAMDMMMPEMSGLAATEYIMAHCPTPILIVSSSVNRAELFTTYQALAAGAVDVLEKPDGSEDEADWAARFVAALKMVARIRVITHPRARLGSLGRARAADAVTVPPRTGMPIPPRVIAIGASTGGPGAIVDILRALPSSLALPILFVLHIDEPFGASFSEWLDGQTGRRVTYAREGELIAAAAGRVLMAPPGTHLTVGEGRARLRHDPERHGCRPSVDVLFEAVASEYGAAAVACLLTGMGRDGAAGLLAVRRAGGATIAQDEASSVVYGMPREAMLIGAAERILSLEEIGPALGALGLSSQPVGTRL